MKHQKRMVLGFLVLLSMFLGLQTVQAKKSNRPTPKEVPFGNLCELETVHKGADNYLVYEFENSNENPKDSLDNLFSSNPNKRNKHHIYKLPPSLTNGKIRDNMGTIPYHYALPPFTQPKRKLLVLLINANAPSQRYLCFAIRAAEAGYHVLIPSYFNKYDLNTLSITESKEYREAINFGSEQRVFNTQIDKINSLESRIFHATTYLSQIDPSWKIHAWKDGISTDDDPAINSYEDIILVGHSYGAGNAAYIAKHRKIYKTILFAGPYPIEGVSDENSSSVEIASWIEEMSSNSKTAKEDFYSVYHKDDWANQNIEQSNKYIFGDSVEPVTVNTVMPSQEEWQILRLEIKFEDEPGVKEYTKKREVAPDNQKVFYTIEHISHKISIIDINSIGLLGEKNIQVIISVWDKLLKVISDENTLKDTKSRDSCLTAYTEKLSKRNTSDLDNLSGCGEYVKNQWGCLADITRAIKNNDQVRWETFEDCAEATEDMVQGDTNSEEGEEVCINLYSEYIGHTNYPQKNKTVYDDLTSCGNFSPQDWACILQYSVHLLPPNVDNLMDKKDAATGCIEKYKSVVK